MYYTDKLGDKRNRRSSKFEDLVRPIESDYVMGSDQMPDSKDSDSLHPKLAQLEGDGLEDDEMEGMYLRLLNEILKEKALSNRRTNQSKLRLL